MGFPGAVITEPVRRSNQTNTLTHEMTTTRRSASACRRHSVGQGDHLGPSGLVASSPTLVCMTAKEQLQRLIAGLGEEESSRALALLEPLVDGVPEPRAGRRRRRMPVSVGIGDSGQSDGSANVDKLLSEGFGG